MMRGACAPLALAAVAAVMTAVTTVAAHSGPPFPIVTDRIAGPYSISIWTDPDASDDRTPAAQFWVVVHSARRGADVSADTRATVTIRPLEREGAAHRGRAEPVNGDTARQFVALLMDHEGRFAVRVDVVGQAGEGTVEAEVEGTYNLRPPPPMIAVYLMPFLAIGAMWLKLLLRRRGTAEDP